MALIFGYMEWVGNNWFGLGINFLALRLALRSVTLIGNVLVYSRQQLVRVIIIPNCFGFVSNILVGS